MIVLINEGQNQFNNIEFVPETEEDAYLLNDLLQQIKGRITWNKPWFEQKTAQIKPDSGIKPAI